MAEKKPCPECQKNGRTSEMKLEKREKPRSGGAMFIGEDVWSCPACGHTVDADQ
jgi:endogenous inhibitor of DNA gyrase (YacG/DUF329 family)